MSSTTTRNKIGDKDIKWWDGITDTFTRETSTGGLLTLNKIGNEVFVSEAYGDGVVSETALSTAINNLGTSRKRNLVLSVGTWPITSNLTIPSNLSLVMLPGAILDIATTKTLTINGPIHADPVQIFSWTGTGAIDISGSPTSKIPIQWFGAVGDTSGTIGTSTNDNAAALNKAVNAVGTNAHQSIYFSGDKIWRLGTGVAYTKAINLSGDAGYRSEIYIDVGANIGITVDSGSELLYNKFANLYITGPANCCTYGLKMATCDVTKFDNVCLALGATQYAAWFNGCIFLNGDIQVSQSPYASADAANGIKIDFNTPNAWSPNAIDLRMKINNVTGTGFYGNAITGGRIWLSCENYGTAFNLNNCTNLNFQPAYIEGAGANSLIDQCTSVHIPAIFFNDSSAYLQIRGSYGTSLSNTSVTKLQIDADSRGTVLGPGSLNSLVDNAPDTRYLGTVAEAVADLNRGIKSYGHDGQNLFHNSLFDRWTSGDPDGGWGAGTWTQCGTGLGDTTNHRTPFCAMFTAAVFSYPGVTIDANTLKSLLGQWANFVLWIKIKTGQTFTAGQYPQILLSATCPNWQATTAYRVGDAVFDTANTYSGAGNYFVAIDVGGGETGDSGGSEPTWVVSAYGVRTTDGDVTWSYRQNGGASSSLTSADINCWREMRIDCYIPKNATAIGNYVYLWPEADASSADFYLAEPSLMVGRLGPRGFVSGFQTTVNSTTLATGAGATTTTVNDPMVTAYSKIFLTPTGANAAVAGVYVKSSDITPGTSFKITHPANPGAAATINYMIVN